MTWARCLRMLLVPLLCVIAGAALARDISQDEALRLRRSGELMPLEALLAVALARYPAASVLEVELEEDKGRYIYEIELLTSNGVRELEIDARTGTVLQDEAED